MLPPWSVLLVGGSSATGKTTATRALAHHYGVSVLQTDDVRMALQQMTTPAQHPALHYFISEPPVWDQPPEQVCDGRIGVANAPVPALAMIMAHHIAGTSPVLIEGDDIVPRLAGQRYFPELRYWTDLAFDRLAVRAVFLVEANEAAVLHNMRSRGRVEYQATESYRAEGHTSWLYRRWLQQEAERYGLPVVPVRPWATLADRIIAIVDDESRCLAGRQARVHASVGLALCHSTNVNCLGSSAGSVIERIATAYEIFWCTCYGRCLIHHVRRQPPFSR